MVREGEVTNMDLWSKLTIGCYSELLSVILSKVWLLGRRGGGRGGDRREEGCNQNIFLMKQSKRQFLCCRLGFKREFTAK